MKKTYNLVLVLFMFLVVQSTFSQLKTISGIVTEKGSKTPLPEVSVFIAQINKGTVTDFDF